MDKVTLFPQDMKKDSLSFKPFKSEKEDSYELHYADDNGEVIISGVMGEQLKRGLDIVFPVDEDPEEL